MAGKHFATESGVFTPEGFAEALAEFGANIRPSIKRALHRTSKIPRAIYMAKARKHGVIKSIFGKNARGLYTLVHTKVVDKGNVFILALELRGLAALQETGGHTRPPRKGAIFPKNRKALKLKVPSLGTVIVASAKHRGANIRRIPSAADALVTAAPRIQAAIDVAIAEFKVRGMKIADSRVVA
jgi:hypothetical protein